METLHGHTQIVLDVKFSPDGRYIQNTKSGGAKREERREERGERRGQGRGREERRGESIFMFQLTFVTYCVMLHGQDDYCMGCADVSEDQNTCWPFTRSFLDWILW